MIKNILSLELRIIVNISKNYSTRCRNTHIFVYSSEKTTRPSDQRKIVLYVILCDRLLPIAIIIKTIEYTNQVTKKIKN